MDNISVRRGKSESQICGVEHIREAIPLPGTIKRVYLYRETSKPVDY